jgi:hypothetical protein
VGVVKFAALRFSVRAGQNLKFAKVAVKFNLRVFSGRIR